MTPDLTTRYLGLAMRSPLVASASPLTGDIDALRRLEAVGAAAVVLPSLFEEQILHETLLLHRDLEAGAETWGEALDFFPALDDYNTGPDRYVALVEAAKTAVDIPVIASLNGTSPGGWLRYAALIEAAGADALELNLYTVAADPETSGTDIEHAQLDVVAAVRDSISIPLAVKLSPFYSSLPHTAAAITAAGADGLVLFNRFQQPDLDPHTREVESSAELSTSAALRLPLRWIAILRGQLIGSLAASGGVHTGLDAAKVILAGADVAMTTSALLRHGPDHLARIEAELADWMIEDDYESVNQLKGSASQHNIADPAAFERAGYLRTLTSYRADP